MILQESILGEAIKYISQLEEINRDLLNERMMLKLRVAMCERLIAH